MSNIKDFEIVNGELIKYNGSDREVVIPDTVTVIGEEAFYYSEIRGVTIPSSVKVIKKSAFQDCTNLYKIEFNEGLEVIEDLAFCNTDLYSIYLPKSLKKLAEDAFADCYSLCDINLYEGVDFEADWFMVDIYCFEEQEELWRDDFETVEEWFEDCYSNNLTITCQLNDGRELMIMGDKALKF